MTDHARQTFFKSDMSTRKRLKGRKKRSEAAVQKSVREICVERDSDRFVVAWAQLGFLLQEASSIPEFAHMHSARRSKTRNQAPEIRHSRKACLILPRAIHRLYDAKELTIEALTDQGADGRLRFAYRGKSYSE